MKSGPPRRALAAVLAAAVAAAPAAPVVARITLPYVAAGLALTGSAASAAAETPPATSAAAAPAAAPRKRLHKSPPATPAATTGAAAAAANTPAATARHQQELQAEQRELKARLAQLKKSLASTESAHSGAADALAASETAISAANRHLQQLAASRRQAEKRIGELQAAERDAAAAQTAHSSRLALALRDQFVLTRTPEIEDMADPVETAAAARAADYLDGVVRERMRRIGELHDRRTELAALEAESVQRRAELERIDADERSSRAQLLKQEAARRATLTRLARELASQRQSVANLERDDARLGSVIDQISKVLADQARRRAAGRAKAAPDGRPGKPDERLANGTAGSTAALDHFEPPAGLQFAHLRGKLMLPVQGAIGSRYGTARLGEDGQPQAGAPTWKGLFIRADAGAPVHAVAAGRVVFADWLRGFGNLLILDHGEGFLSVYANNETLLHGVGDAVAADDVIAAVGNTGGNAQSGLYFEMRFQGRPFDPLAWAAAR